MMMETFLPSMRSLVSRRLSEEGYSQGRIARLLGITQASVSIYLSRDSAGVYEALSGLSVAREDAERYSALLAEDVKRNPVDAVSTLYSIWSGILGGALACGLHREGYPFLAECDVCMKTFGRRMPTDSEAVDHVSKAVAMLESSTTFVRVMPEVSVNLAFAPAGAKTPNEVVAIPGRIVRVKNSARSLSGPEYGASSHLAKVLLLVRRGMKEVSAVINLRYDRKMKKVLTRLRLRSIEIGGSYPEGTDDPVVEAIRSRLASTEAGFETIVDEGGPGMEPSLYLLGSDAVSVAKLALKISRAYVAS